MAKNKKRCITTRCTNRPQKGRLTCATCTRKKWRVQNPEKYAFFNLKYNAKRRGKIFTLTFSEFVEFAHATNYIAGRGKTAESLSIDCIIPELGYTRNNIQALSLSDNGRKADRMLVYDWQTKTATVIKYTAAETDIENPF